MTCKTCQTLSALDGWETVYCPVCEREHAMDFSPREDREGGCSVPEPASAVPCSPVVRKSVLDGKGLVEVLILKEKSKKCKCPHDGSDSDPCKGNYQDCYKCQDVCCPF